MGNGYCVPDFEREKTRSYREMGRSAHLLALRRAYVVSVRQRTGTIMDAIIRLHKKGGGVNRSRRQIICTAFGAILPCPVRGRTALPTAMRGGSFQGTTSRRGGLEARRAERENGPAAPVGGSVRDKEKP